MGYGVFIHRADSVYEDDPARQYQFPAMYLSRAAKLVGDWIVYYEPTKVRRSKGYFAVARVADIIPDPQVDGMFVARIEPETYLEFPTPVPFASDEGVIEKGLLNAAGRNSGRAQAAVRPLSPQDFGRIVNVGLGEAEALLPRVGYVDPPGLVVPGLADAGQVPFDMERERIDGLTSRIVRDRVFRRLILNAYGERCCVTGLRLINGGGRAEVEAAHIRPVEANGPDRVQNGLALSGTVHWMFDRGLISFGDDHEIMVSRQVNDRNSIDSLINRTGRLLAPRNERDWPHPMFLAWHREHRFKV